MNKKNILKIVNKELTILKDIIDDFNESDEISTFEIDLALSKATDVFNILSLLKGSETTKSAQSVIAEKPTFLSNATNPQSLIGFDKEETTDTIPAPEDLSPTKNNETEPVLNRDHKDTPPQQGIKLDVPKTVLEDNKNAIIEEVVDEPIEAESEFENGLNETKEEEPEVTEEEEEVPQSLIKKEEKTTDSKNKKASTNSKGEILADQFQSKKVSVNDMLSSFKKDKNLATSLTDRPIKDLQKAVKLNDRIWYIQELFDKKTELYNKTIAELNKFDNLDAALTYLFERFEWDQSKKSTISFLELIYRRFSN